MVEVSWKVVAMKRWTKEDDSKLLTLARQGYTRDQISRALGKTRNAVSGRLYRIAKDEFSVQSKWVPISENNPRQQLLERIESSGVPLDVMTEESGIRIREHNPSWRRGTQKMRDSTAYAIERYLDGIERKAD